MGLTRCIFGEGSGQFKQGVESVDTVKGPGPGGIVMNPLNVQF